VCVCVCARDLHHVAAEAALEKPTALSNSSDSNPNEIVIHSASSDNLAALLQDATASGSSTTAPDYSNLPSLTKGTVEQLMWWLLIDLPECPKCTCYSKPPSQS